MLPEDEQPLDGGLLSFLVLSLTPHSQPESRTVQPTHEGTVVNTDLSVAPEIAQLAAPLLPVQQDAAAPRTDGRIAGDLAALAAAPQRWWDLVRFDPAGPVRIPVPGAPAPGCSCCRRTPPSTATARRPPRWPARRSSSGRRAVGGAASGAPARPLRPGRVRVHGTPAPHRLRAAGPGYSVTLHTAVSRTRSE